MCLCVCIVSYLLICVIKNKTYCCVLNATTLIEYIIDHGNTVCRRNNGIHVE